MKIKIISDSCCDITKEMKAEMNVSLVPYKMYIEDEEFIDDDNIDVLNFIDKMTKSAVIPRSACPSPQEYMDLFEGEEDVYVVTLSSKLSGVHGVAEMAKKLYLEDHPDKFIHIFDSKAAAAAQVLSVLRIYEEVQKGSSREEIVKNVTKYIDDMQTVFVAESLNNLIKNGRISKLKGALANAMNIRLVMRATDEGEIDLLAKARGSKKVFEKLLDNICEKAGNSAEKTMAIVHINNLEKAKEIENALKERCPFKEVVILQSRGLSSLYCDNKGIIVSF